MLELRVENGKIVINEEVRKLFSKKMETKEFDVKDIKALGKELLENEVIAITIFFKDNTEKHIAKAEVNDIVEVFNKVESLRNEENNFKVTEFNIETGEERVL